MRYLLPLLLLCGFAVFAENLLIPGNFEGPFVNGRTPKEQGGDPSNSGKGPGWVSFRFQTTAKSPEITGGLTTEVARNGKQSLYVDFNHVDRGFEAAILVSDFIPVVSGSVYQVGIWGRTDAKDLINSDGRSAYLKLEVDYFAKDANESIGESYYAVQPLPGSKGHLPFFHTDRWTRYYMKITPPPGTVFAQVIWRWQSGSDPGEVNGLTYWDDATFDGPPAPDPNMTPAPVQEDADTPTPSPSDSPAAGQ